MTFKRMSGAAFSVDITGTNRLSDSEGGRRSGYEQGRSIKDNTQLRRGQNRYMYHVISFTADIEFSGKKDECLSLPGLL